MACHLRYMKLAFWARYSGAAQRTAAVRKATNELNRNLRPSKFFRLSLFQPSLKSLYQWAGKNPKAGNMILESFFFGYL